MGVDQFGERLRVAMERWHGDPNAISAFSKEMESRGVRGASRGMIRQYLTGSAKPTIEFADAAARLLGVPVEFLVRGEEQEEASDAVQAAVRLPSPEGQEPLGARLKHAVLDALGRDRPIQPPLRIGGKVYPEDVPYWVAPLAEVWNRWTTMALATPGYNYNIDIPGTIAEAVAAPLHALGVDATQLSEQQLGEYVLPVASALLQVVRYGVVPTPSETED